MRCDWKTSDEYISMLQEKPKVWSKVVKDASDKGETPEKYIEDLDFCVNYVAKRFKVGLVVIFEKDDTEE